MNFGGDLPKFNSSNENTQTLMLEMRNVDVENTNIDVENANIDVEITNIDVENANINFAEICQNSS
jgi:hypothetical protein